MTHPGRLVVQSFTKDGKRLVAADTQAVRVWDLAGTPEKRLLAQHTGGVPTVTFNSDGRLLASAGKDRTVVIWNTETGKIVQRLTDFRDVVQALAFDPHNRFLVTGDGSGTVRIWDIHSWRELMVLDQDLGLQIWEAAFRPDGRCLAVAGDHGVGFWDIESSPDEKSPVRFSPRGDVKAEADITCICFSPDGNFLAYVQIREDWRGGLLRVYDVANSRPHAWTPLSIRGPVHGVGFTHDSRERVFVNESGDAEVREVEMSRQRFPFVRRERDGSRFSAGVGILGLSADGIWLASQAGQIVTVWDMAREERVLALSEAPAEVWCLAWSPDRRHLAIGLSNGGLMLWDLERVRAELNRIGLGW